MTLVIQITIYTGCIHIKVYLLFFRLFRKDHQKTKITNCYFCHMKYYVFTYHGVIYITHRYDTFVCPNEVKLCTSIIEFDIYFKKYLKK